MAEKADFYVLPANDAEARSRFLCRLMEKIGTMGHHIFIHTGNESEAKRIDQLLWEYKAESFIPHSLLNDTTPAKITIGWDDQRPEQQDVFVNLHLDIPNDALKFKRILEIVVQSEDILTSTRSNYKVYQSNGVQIDMHDMRPKPKV